EGLAAVKLNNRVGYIDKTGEIQIPFNFLGGDKFQDGIAIFANFEQKFGLIDKNGNQIVPAKYDYIKSFSNGLWAVYHNKKWGIIDKTGREIVPPKYGDSIYTEYFSDGALRVEVNEKYGFLDDKGNVIIPLIYDYAWEFHNGLAKVRLNDKSDFIDRKST